MAFRYIFVHLLMGFYSQEDLGICTIPEFYAYKNIFITGATGFLGKVLVEKLLRSCPDVSHVYLLIREKKGLPAQERWNKISHLPACVFSKLRNTNSNALEKVVVVSGDLAMPGLGLKESDKQILSENVDIIFHSAALVQFTNDIIFSIKENLYGTLQVAELARSMKKIKKFVHISTSFSNVDDYEKKKDEKMYDSIFDWKVLLELSETEPEKLMFLKDKLLNGHPTAYTFTKNLAERIMLDFSKFFAVVVMRPSIITCCYEEPIKGWADTLNGLTAASLGFILGVLRTVPSLSEEHLDYVSADHAAKALILAPWLPSQRNDKTGIHVFGCNYGSKIALTGKMLFEIGQDLLKYYPSSNILWYPFFIFASNSVLKQILFILLQVIPAYIADTVLWAVGQRQRLVAITKKIAANYEIAIFFGSKSFAFSNTKFLEMNEAVMPQDKEEFYISFNKVNPVGMVKYNMLGMMEFIVKEDVTEEAFKKNKKRLKRNYTCYILSLMLNYMPPKH